MQSSRGSNTCRSVIAIEISLNILGVQKFLERQVSELPPAQPTNQPTFSMFLSDFQRFLAFRNFSTNTFL